MLELQVVFCLNFIKCKPFKINKKKRKKKSNIKEETL